MQIYNFTVRLSYLYVGDPILHDAKANALNKKKENR